MVVPYQTRKRLSLAAGLKGREAVGLTRERKSLAFLEGRGAGLSVAAAADAIGSESTIFLRLKDRSFEEPAPTPCVLVDQSTGGGL